MHEAYADLPFGQWLRDRRKARDLTQEELSERAGCSTAMIRKLEAGRARPSRQLAELLAAALALAPDERAVFVQRARSTPEPAGSGAALSAERPPSRPDARPGPAPDLAPGQER